MKKNKTASHSSKKKKNPFKVFVNMLTFLIFLGFCGFVFYLGWVQFSIPENNYALIFTKTSGYDTSLMKAGEFHWRWENLFPTNMTLHTFPLPWDTTDLEVSGILPSGEEYASILPEGASFHFQMKMVIQYRLNPENISYFIKDDNFQYSDIANWYDTIPLKAESVARETLLAAFHSSDKIDLPQLEKQLSEQLIEKNPPLEIKELHIRNWTIPDLTLYNNTREIYLKGIQASRVQIAELEKQNTELENKLSNKMDLLKDYGQVLTDYPVLLQYFNLEKDKIDPMIFSWEEMRSPDPES